MGDRKGMIDVELSSPDLADRLRRASAEGLHARLLDGGTPIATTSPAFPAPPRRRTLEPVDPRLQVTIRPGIDLEAGVPLEDWPEQLR